MKYMRASMGFPTGLRESSGLILEKTVPVEVNVGQPFSYEYKVSNVTGCHIHQVSVWDRVTDNFAKGDASPAATSVEGGVATWKIDHMAPGETKVIKVNGRASTEGTITTCGWASYMPILCEPIKVVKPAIELVKSMPAQVSQCDPIPVKLTVKNSGSSTLTMVKVTDTLPAGLTTDAGASSASFDAGTLAPGATKDFTFTAKATRTGSFTNPAKATCAQGVEADASAQVVVTKPVLTIACEAPDNALFGRPFDICYTVRNTGDAPAQNVVLSATLGGARFSKATEGGSASGANASWNLGTLAPGATKRVCVTLSGDASSVNFSANAQAACAEQVSTTCKTLIRGVPGVLLEVVDSVDPIQVGETTVYTIRVTNQGAIPISNIRIDAKRDAARQETISAEGATALERTADGYRAAALSSLAPKAVAEWRVTVKATAAGNAVYTVTATADDLGERSEIETTNQY